MSNKNIIINENQTIIKFEFQKLNLNITIQKCKLGEGFNFNLLEKKFNTNIFIVDDSNYYLYHLLEILRDNTILYNKSKLTSRDEIDNYIKSSIKFNIPSWVLDKLYKIKYHKDFINEKIKEIFSSKIKLCKICGQAFKEEENTPTSCKVHREKLKYPFEFFSCCGVRRDEGDQKPCCIGYHFEDKEYIIKNINSLSYKLFEQL